MSDVDTTHVEYSIQYACDHKYPALGVIEDFSGPESRFSDGVLTVPVDCAACLDLPTSDAPAYAWPGVLDMIFADDWADIDEWPEPLTEGEEWPLADVDPWAMIIESMAAEK